MAKKLKASKVRSCLSAAINITDDEAAELAEFASKYPGDETQAYIAAVENKLSELEQFRFGVVEAKREAEVAAAKAAAAAAPLPYANAEEAWDDMAPDGFAFADLPEDAQKKWQDAFDKKMISGKIAEELIPTYANVDEAWMDMRPQAAEDLDISLSKLPRALQLEWMQAFANGSITQPFADELYTRADVELTVLDNFNIQLADTKDSLTAEEFEASIPAILRVAFFDSDPNNVRSGMTATAQSYVLTEIPIQFQSVADNEFIKLVNENMRLMATTGTKEDRKERAWYSYAKSRNLLSAVTAKVTAVPEADAALIPKNTATQATVEETEVEEDTEDTKPPEIPAAQRLFNLINNTWSVGSKQRKAAKDLFEAVKKAGQLAFVVRNGTTIADYFKEDGTPKLRKLSGVTKFTTEERTPTQQRQAEQLLRDAQRLLRLESIAEAQKKIDERNRNRRIQAEQRAAQLGLTQRGAVSEASTVSEEDVEETTDLDEDLSYDEDTNDLGLAFDQGDGEFFRDDGTPLTTTLPIGRVKMIVSSFVSKLFVKPKTFVFKNLADLKASNPSLYARAKAARPQGDFDTTPAVGYSFGDTVIIFSDMVRTEAQLRFVLAHEVLGHFGFKGVIPEGKLAAVLTDIYEADPDVRAAVEAMMATRGMSKLEAVEEYVSDYAAYIDNSVLMKIWNVLANFLNKLGVKFKDDAARYLINQSRKYVRRGTGNIVTSRRIMSDMNALAREGRYNVANSGDLLSSAMAVAGGNSRAGGTGGLAGVADAFNSGLFGARKNIPGKIASILEHLQTLDYMARRSYGLSQLYQLLERQQQTARKLLSKYNEMMNYVVSPTIFGFGTGVTEDDKLRGGELLAHAALLRGNNLDDVRLRGYPPLIAIDAAGNVTIDNAVRAQLERDGFVSAAEFTNGFDVEYKDGDNVRTFRFQRDINENDPQWKIYQAVRKTVNEAAIDLMLSNYEAAKGETTRVINELNDRRPAENVFTDLDLSALREVARLYQDIRYSNASVSGAQVRLSRQSLNDAEAFLISFGRALYDEQIYNIWTLNPEANAEIMADQVSAASLSRGATETTHGSFQDAAYDSLREVLPSLAEKIRNREDSFRIQKAIRDLFLFDLQSKNAEYYAKRTILGAYVPFTRRGEFQVRLVAVDSAGNPIRLSDETKSMMPYFQFATEAEAAVSLKELNDEFGGRDWSLTDDTGNEITVRFKAAYSKVRSTPDLTESVNFNEFVYALNRLNISVNPQERERIVTTLTDQNNRARKNLQRSGNPGWDKDVVRGVSEHIETTAHVAAKKLYKHRINDVLLKESNWKGDSTKLRALKRRVEQATTDAQRAQARREYDAYAYMYQYMADVTGEMIEVGGKMVPTLGRGEDYREAAKSVIRWYSETGNITDSTEDILSGDIGSQLKLFAVLAQLGGSVASAAINLVSLSTHSIPYLAFYNSNTAVGGGYGFAQSSSAIFSAVNALKNANFSDAAFIRKLIENNTFSQYGLSRDETEVLLQQTEEGSLQAAQFNSLVGTARGKVFNNKAAAAIRAWMGMFSYTEQLNRRATSLAAYRLEKERALSEGLSEVEAIARASEAARTAVNTSQGEYAMFNRSKMARGDIMQFIFMYKQFVIITVQLLKAMDWRGRALALGILLLAGGMKGLPFGEDILDIIDTIAQKLGLSIGSVEKELIEFLDGVAPGLGYIAMNGVMNRWTGATISTRLGMGDILPLTGAFRAGADPVRELSNFAGPVVGGISGAVATVAGGTKYLAETVGLRDDTTSFSSILRDNPVSALRAVADALTYMEDGRITNAKGQVVSNDVTIATVLSRAFGFYPAIATEQNDVVRMSRYVAEWGKEVKAAYVSAYVKAKLNKDTARMQQIVKDVQAWNEGTIDNGLKITRFVQSANRSAREMSRPTALRYLKSAPTNVRPETLALIRAYDLEEDLK
jgi:hypothetical protein